MEASRSTRRARPAGDPTPPARPRTSAVPRLTALVAAGLLLAAPTAGGAPFPDAVLHAQAVPDSARDGTDTLPAPDDTVEVEDLVVTAHRTPVPEDQLTGSVTVIDRPELAASGVESLGDVLGSVAGAHVARTGSFGGATSLFLRGGESDFVQVLVDGVPVNRPGGSADLSGLTTDNVQRVEVVRGPTSVLYGSDAATGVIQIFTRTGEGPPTWSASAEAGSYGTLDWRSSVRGGSGAVGYSASVSRRVTDGIQPFNNDFRNLVGSARIEARPTDRTDVGLSLRYRDSEFHVPTNSAGQPVDRNAVQTEEQLTLGLDAGHRFTERLEGRLQLATNEIDAAFDDRPDGPADTLGFFGFQSQEDVGRRSADARLQYHLDPRTVFTAGVEVEHEEERRTSESSSQFGPSRTGPVDRERDNLGYYVQALTRVEGRLSLSGGARIDDNEEFGTFETFRLGAAYDFPTGTRVRGSWGNAFREPSFTENFGSPPFRGNPDLAPEETESWELGVEQELWDGRMTLHGVYFDQRFRDLIQFTFDAAPDEPNYFNVGGAESRGVEAGLELRLPADLRFEGSYTHLDTEVTDSGFDEGPDATFVEGRPLLRRPTHAVDATLRWSREALGSAWIRVDWVGERADRDFSTTPAERVTLPDYARVDAAVRLGILESRSGVPVTPTVRVENLFDATYREVANFPAPGRTILAGFDLRVGL